MFTKSNYLAKALCFIMLLLVSSSIFAQKQITGKITGPNNQPVPGATIIVKGTTVATQANEAGEFTITVPAGKNVLAVSSVGFDTQEINIGNQNTLALSLRSTTSSLNEVVVTGYTAQRKKEVSGAVSVVNVNNLKQQPVGTGEEALQGQASGVTVITSGQPGAASDIRIRGITGFGNNQPLIIIDGTQGSLHDINVNDIESLQVLKDASASIYGVRGSNGVIIVTTKRGKTGKARVTYDAYYGVATRGEGIEMASPLEAANAIWLQQRNSGIANPSSKQYGTGANPVLPEYLFPTGFTGSVDLSKYDKDANQIVKANHAGTNWYNEITRNARRQSHNVSVSAGTDKSSYYFSVGYLNEEGIAKYQYNNRYSVRANTQFNIKNNIRVGENAYVFYKQNPRFGNQGEGSPFTTVFREDPIIPVYDVMGNFAGTKAGDLGNARNPFADIYRTKDNKSHTWDVLGNIFAEADILKHFTLRTQFGGSIDNNYNYNFNFVGYENAEGNTGTNSFSEGAGYGSSWTWTNTLNYSNNFGDHGVRILLGTEAINSYYRFLGATRSDYFSENPNYWVIDRGAGSQSNSGNAGQQSLWSQFARADYNFQSKYILSASVRRDGSSVFAEDVRFGYFPSVSAAWRISQENFMKGISFINDLKLRYSWGKLGSAANVVSTNPLDLYSSRAGKSFYDIAGISTGANAGFYRSNVGNPATTWEGDIISNAGIDATIFNNKLDLSIDWYKKKVSGLLFRAEGTQWDRIFVGDADLPKINIGDMQNTGIDANVTYHGAIGTNLKFDVTGVFTSYNNKIVDIPGAGFFSDNSLRNLTLVRNMEGHPVGSFFGYNVIGIFQDDNDVTKSATQNGAEPGVFKYQDVDANGKIDEDDRTFIGNPNPDFTYGLNLSVAFKNFDFSAFFFGSKGNDIFNQTLTFTDFPDFFKGGLRREVALNSWTPNNKNTSIPKLRTSGSFSTDLATNSYFISKGSYLRAKQMQLGYTVPTSTLSRYGIDRFRIYVQAANLFTITNYNGVDPELQSFPNFNAGTVDNTSGFGIDAGNYPHTPLFLVGVNLNF
jgi:TonB-dependent starch-binding outer membrane protein SusC